MVESLEESPPSSEAESALENNQSDLPEEGLEAVTLEAALPSPDAGSSEENIPKTPQFASLGEAQESRRAEGMMPQGALLMIPVNVQVILGTTRMPLHKVMALGPGSVVALEKEISQPVALLVNGNEIARGQIVIVNEKTGQLGISLTEILPDSSGKTASKPV